MITAVVDDGTGSVEETLTVKVTEEEDGPGFGPVIALAAVVMAGLVMRRWRQRLRIHSPSWHRCPGDTERGLTRQLRDPKGYRPDSDPGLRRRGRPSKKSPGDRKKEEQLLGDYRRIPRRLGILKWQLDTP